MKKIHELQGHSGFNRMSYEIKNIKKFYWKNMYLDCKKYVENCRICLIDRGGIKIKPKSKQIFPNGPLDRIVADTWELPENLKKKTNIYGS